MATGRGPAASGGYASRVVLHPRKLETNVTLEFAKLNIKLISPFTKMATNKNIISILSSYVRSTELSGKCFYDSAETLSLESPFRLIQPSKDPSKLLRHIAPRSETLDPDHVRSSIENATYQIPSSNDYETSNSVRLSKQEPDHPALMLSLTFCA